MNKINDLITVLVIDDEKIIRQSFCDQLEDLGYRVMTAENGRAGIELLHSAHLDLILTDLRMPEIDGLEFIRHCKESDPDIPIIVISGVGRISDAVEALRRGADDYLIKPVNDLAMLEHRVDKALEKASLLRENRAYQAHLEELVDERTRELEQANLQMSQFNRRLRKIVESGSDLLCCFDEQTFGSRLLEQFANNMAVTGGSLYLVEGEGLRLVHSLDPGHCAAFLSFPLAPSSVFKQVLTSSKSLLIRNIKEADSIKSSGWRGYSDVSLLAFPIPDILGNAIGIVALHSKDPPPFVEQDQEIGSLLAAYGSETLRAVKAFESLRDSDTRYRTLFDKTNDAIFLVNRLSGRFEDANEAASRLTGRPVNELKTLTIGDVTLTEPDNLLEAADESNLTRDLGIVTYARPDESRRIARLNSVLLDREAVVVIARDITEEQGMEEQMRRVHKMDAVGQLTGGIAHDFNNILAIVLGNLNLLERQISNDDAMLKRVLTIKKSAERAVALTKRLLSFSRKQTAQVAVTNVNNIIDAMKNLIARSLTPEIEIAYSLAGELWVTAIDSGDLEDALLNLVINARDAMSGGGKVVLATCNKTFDRRSAADKPGIEPGDYVQLTVSDTGEGMTAKIQQHIFEPFFTTKEPGKGTGLGLSMVFGFVKRSGGHIKVYSQPGDGATFRLYFPRVKGEQPLHVQPISVLEQLPGGTATILVVDDEAGLLDIAKESLQTLGYRVVTAGNGPQALELLAKEPQIKLLFSDVVMPGGINGYELAALATKGWPGIKVLLTSGFTGRAAVDDRLDPLRINLLRKPYSLSTLAQRIHLLLCQSDIDKPE